MTMTSVAANALSFEMVLSGWVRVEDPYGIGKKDQKKGARPG